MERRHVNENRQTIQDSIGGVIAYSTSHKNVQELYQASSPRVLLVKSLVGHLILAIQILLKPLKLDLDASNLLPDLSEADRASLSLGDKENGDEAVQGALIGITPSPLACSNLRVSSIPQGGAPK